MPKSNDILVVDDEENIRELFSQAFGMAGYKVHTAESAEDALDVINQKNFNVMFLDLSLPKMDGVELCRRIKKDRPIAIIFAITGYASLFELSECREAGFEDYFIKPVDLQTLFKAAEYAFEKINRWKKR